MTGCVDSHCHVAPNWYEPLDSLLYHMDRNRVEQAVLVQLLGCHDNRYLLECVARYPTRLSAVVAVDATHPQALRDLEELKQRGAGGVRLRPTSRSPGEDPLAIWRVATRLGLPVSCVGNTTAFCSPDFEGVLDSLPEATIVLEHLGGTSAADGSAELKGARKKVLDLARFENVYLKIPGLGEFEPRAASLAGAEPPIDLTSAANVLEGVLAKFSPGRLMWGSDFPVVSSREGYANALAWTRELIDRLAEEASPEIFGGTARRVFFRRSK